MGISKIVNSSNILFKKLAYICAFHKKNNNINFQQFSVKQKVRGEIDESKSWVLPQQKKKFKLLLMQKSKPITLPDDLSHSKY